MEEIWKDIDGYEGLYMVSSFGNVKSLDRKVLNKGKLCIRKGKVLNKLETWCGYFRVRLYKNGKYKFYLIHRLVAETFIPNPNKFNVVNHIDYNKKNNNIENLEWCSQSYNMIHAINKNPSILKGLESYIEKNKKPVIQYTAEGVFVREFESIPEASKVTKISYSHIREVANKTPCHKGRWIRKTAGGFIWKFKEESV